MKLWQKSKDRDQLIHRFTVGNDREFDMKLARYDVVGSIAHVKMLARCRIITAEENSMLIGELENILVAIDHDLLRIDPECEDIHSMIETLLTQKLGDTGKKVHTARSRNDQSLLDIKLYLRDEISVISGCSVALAETLLKKAEEYLNDLLPGYTHFQLAMPSSFGLWFSAYAESIADDLEMMKAAHRIANQNPLGSAAGYGSSFPIDREFTTCELNFAGMNVNSVYAQMTRGKTERATAFALSSIGATIGKLASDIILFMNQEFGYISFPEELTTGSSIMPHKKNPDPWELIRAKCNRIQSVPNELTLLMTNLPSGYHRDYQLTKEILFPAIESLKQCLEVGMVLLENIIVRKNILSAQKYDALFTVDAINELVKEGVPFRDAYRQVGKQFSDGKFVRPAISRHTHMGSIGNPGIELIKNRISEFSIINYPLSRLSDSPKESTPARN